MTRRVSAFSRVSHHCPPPWRHGEFSSAAPSCPTLCNPMDCSVLGFPVHHKLPELAQIHVHWIRDAIQPSHPLLPPSPSCPQSFPASESFPMSQLFISCGQSIRASVSASVLPMNIQSWFPLKLTGLISFESKGLYKESFPAPQFESISSLALNLLYGLTLTSIHDYWKSHSFDSTDLCQQSDVSAF